MEPIVFVNEAGEPTGQTAPKLESHHEDTELHLAFSCYVFNDNGELLVTKRADVKKVWPGFWSNSVCGHPGPGENLKDAITRRLDYELGMQADHIKPVLPNYSYKAPPYNGIIEHEFCPVFVARATSDPKPNLDEVSEYKWIHWSEFVSELEKDANTYEQFAIADDLDEWQAQPKWSWWCKDQLKQLKDNSVIQEYSQQITS